MTGDDLKNMLVRQAAIAELEEELLTKGLTSMCLAGTVAKLMNHGLEAQRIAEVMSIHLVTAKKYFEALRFVTESEFELLVSLTGGLYPR